MAASGATVRLRSAGLVLSCPFVGEQDGPWTMAEQGWNGVPGQLWGSQPGLMWAILLPGAQINVAGSPCCQA